MESKDGALPLVYSCSGCSSAAQLANHVALQLDRRGAAEMSCIAGVGGDVPALLKLAASGRRIVVIDGCALACARHCLARHALEPELHLQLGEHGVKKRRHADFCPEQAEEIVQLALAMLGPPAENAAAGLPPQNAAPPAAPE